MKRPLVRVGLILATGILVGHYLPLNPLLLLGFGIALAMLAIAWVQARSLLLYPLIFVTGWTNLSLRTAVISPYDVRKIFSQEPALTAIRGSLVETPSLR